MKEVQVHVFKWLDNELFSNETALYNEKVPSSSLYMCMYESLPALELIPLFLLPKRKLYMSIVIETIGSKYYVNY